MKFQLIANSEISTTTEIAAIATIGCVSGALASGDCAASATSSVIGALAGDLSHDNKSISKGPTSPAKLLSAVAAQQYGYS